MTIAAGFVVRDGILICSDSEHSAGGILTHEPKLVSGEFSSGKAIFAFAGNAELAVAAIQKCVHALQSAPGDRIKSDKDIADIIEKTVEAEYRKHVSVEPNPNADNMYDILAAVWCEKDPAKEAALYRTWQGSIRKVSRYDCIGSGYYLGRYVIESMPGAVDIERARVVATYTLAIAKRFVDGCGGNSHMASLKNDGTVIGSSGPEREPLEQALRTFDEKTTRLLFSLLAASDAGFSKALSDFDRDVHGLRVGLGLDENSKEAAKKEMESLQSTIKGGSTLEATVSGLQRK